LFLRLESLYYLVFKIV